MSILVSLAIYAIEYYINDNDIPLDDRNRMKIEFATISNDNYIPIHYMEWDELLLNDRLCEIVYIALKNWENKKFENISISRMNVGDVRSMMGEIKYKKFN